MKEKLKELLESTGANYFSSNKSKEKWQKDYEKKLKSIYHDEPWLTFMAIYALFGKGDYTSLQKGVPALNAVLRTSNMDYPEFLEIKVVKVERRLIEVRSLRNHVKETLRKKNIKHLYPDREEKLEKKIGKPGTKETVSSFEGNTNLDLYICGKDTAGNKIALYIEAKFLSDISHDTTYLIGRDQIIRNIDSLIDDHFEEFDCNIDHKYFLLLTPELFKESKVGNQYIESLYPAKSRLYCYKYLEYKNASNLKKCLPYRTKFTNADWINLANRVGWITFDDIIKQANKLDSNDSDFKEIVNNFFKERNLT